MLEYESRMYLGLNVVKKPNHRAKPAQVTPLEICGDALLY